MKELSIAIAAAVLIAMVTLTVVEISRDDGDRGLAALDASTLSDAGLRSGAELFVSSGCATCHGPSGDGGVGPALAGHTIEQVIRQSRRPLNAMPLFTSDELSDEELERVAVFVADLASEDAAHEAHDESAEGALDSRDEIAMHHWLALGALRAGVSAAAAAHVHAVINAVGGEHEAAMLDAFTAIESGDLSAAEGIVVEMLAGFVPDLTDEQILLRLVLQALVVDELTEAITDLEAAIEIADASAIDQLETALDMLRRGDIDEAQELISPLSGLPEHEEDEDHSAEGDEDADEHRGDEEDVDHQQ